MSQAKPYSPAQQVADSSSRGICAFKLVCGLVVLFGITGAAGPTARAQTVVTLYNFAGAPDGGTPYANVIRDAAGNLYGTTGIGGASNSGAVFQINSQGTETILHSFAGPPGDGGGPFDGLVRDAAGNLYGTTSYGGTFNLGTVFKITPGGEERILHSFNGSDGSQPYGGLFLNAEGDLVGTTVLGGTGNCPSVGNEGCGTIFVVSRSGEQHVLYSFQGGLDGAFPSSNLVRDSTGRLYGTTQSGGCSDGENCGTVFRISKAGEEVLHRFGGPGDGTGPNQVIFGPDGNLYGTTISGGSHSLGTVFVLTPTGDERVLYSFGNISNDGSYPQAGLVWGGAEVFYGTTNEGGAPGCLIGCGTIFSVTRSGLETVLYSFGANGVGGFIPFAGLTLGSNGRFYGTTGEGGPTDNGTVFEFTP
jgi:uncharacterized repeat protein (TIGR03803 family)